MKFVFPNAFIVCAVISLSRFCDMLGNEHSKVSDAMDAKNDAINTAYGAMREALILLNTYPATLGSGDRHLFRSSYLGNDKLVVAKDMSDKLWVASHSTLRDYTGVVGGLLDIEALENHARLSMFHAKLDSAQSEYYKATLAILEDSAEAIRENPDLKWKGGLNRRGQPIMDADNHLIELKNQIVTPNHKALWKRYDAADAAMGNALRAMTVILKNQRTVPLTWVDAQDVTHHVVLDKATFGAPGKVCELLYLLSSIEKWGQINSLMVSESASEILKTVGQTATVFTGLDNNFLRKLQTADCSPLKEYLHARFVTLRSAHDIDTLREDPVARACFNTGYFKEAFDALEISKYPVRQVSRDRLAHSTPSRDGVCPITGGGRPTQDSDAPKAKHWCVQVLEGCANIPAAHGYGAYR